MGGGGPSNTYATWNPSDKGSGVTLSVGNLEWVGRQTNGGCRATIGKSSGKWYWEMYPRAAGGRYGMVGVANSSANIADYPGSDVHGWSYDGGGVSPLKYHSATGTAYGSLVTTPFVTSVLLDMDAGELTFWRNGSTMGLAYTGLTGTIFPMAGGDTNSVDSGLLANFGATAFSYSPPAGYNAGLYL